MEPAACPINRLELEFEPGSYRDRNGKIFYAGGAVYRALSERALSEWESLVSKQFFRRSMAEGKIVHTERMDPAERPDVSFPPDWAAFLKHQAIPFISYPY